MGETLTADTSGIADADGLANATFSYQWLADDTDIAGATGSTYTLTDSEESKAITVQVSFTDDADNGETLTSAATDAVAGAQPTEPPAKPRGLDATATHDSVTLTWDDPGDDTITGYVILRRIPGDDPEGHFDVLVADTGTAAITYTDDTVSAETRYTYRIKAINPAGVSERSRWSHIDVPAAPVPDKPTGLEATVSHGQVTLTWDDPGDDSITGYVILPPRPRQRSRWRLQCIGGEHGQRRHHLHRRPRWRPAPPTPTASRPSTSTGRASAPAGSTSARRQPRSRYRGLCRRGAICAGDGRRLSSDSALTVSGRANRGQREKRAYKGPMGKAGVLPGTGPPGSETEGEGDACPHIDEDLGLGHLFRKQGGSR